tara:strand:+ start:544 stop:723 length:180 start_codon:yes stop_codon:yes gene_type:complete
MKRRDGRKEDELKKKGKKRGVTPVLVLRSIFDACALSDALSVASKCATTLKDSAECAIK